MYAGANRSENYGGHHLNAINRLKVHIAGCGRESRIERFLVPLGQSFLGGALLLALLLSIPGMARAAAKQIGLYTYHTHAPFIIDQKTGLSYDLAAYLSQKSNGRYVFKVVPMSRPRLNKMLEQGGDFLVPWVNPAWFKDRAERKYLWSRSVLMADANGIVSHKRLPITYLGPASLSGLVFGGIRGHNYTGIDDFIAASEASRRVDSDNHLTNFRKLMKGRIQVTLTPESAARYLIGEHGFGEELFLSPSPHSRYRRGLLSPKGNAAVMAYIDGLSAEFGNDPEWSRIRGRYR